MIIAAGFGTSMRPLTDDRPKALIEVAGKSLLSHALDPAWQAGLAPLCVNAHYKAEAIEAALAGSDVQVLVERPEILDTGGGLKAALPHLPGEAVFTMNSDAVWAGPNPFEALRAAWNPDAMGALLLCVPMARAEGRSDAGDFMIAGAQIIRGPGFVYTGAQIISAAAVAAHPERVFSFNTLWDAMNTEGRLAAAIFPLRWCDVGRPDSIPVAEAMAGV